MFYEINQVNAAAREAGYSLMTAQAALRVLRHVETGGFLGANADQYAMGVLAQDGTILKSGYECFDEGVRKDAYALAAEVWPDIWAVAEENFRQAAEEEGGEIENGEILSPEQMLVACGRLASYGGGYMYPGAEVAIFNPDGTAVPFPVPRHCVKAYDRKSYGEEQAEALERAPIGAVLRIVEKFDRNTETDWTKVQDGWQLTYQK